MTATLSYLGTNGVRSIMHLSCANKTVEKEKVKSNKYFIIKNEQMIIVNLTKSDKMKNKPAEKRFSHFNEFVNNTLKEKDRNLIYQDFGKFVARFEDHIEHLREVIHTLMISEGLNNKHFIDAIVLGNNSKPILDLISKLVYHKYKEFEVNGFSTEPHKTKSDFGIEMFERMQL